MTQDHERLETAKLVTLLLDQLTSRQRDAIVLHFGLFGVRLRVSVIARQMGTSRQNVDQLIDSATASLGSAVRVNERLKHELRVFQADLLMALLAHGGSSRVDALPQALGIPDTTLELARVSFIARFTPLVTYLPENDEQHEAISIFSSERLHETLSRLVTVVRSHPEPISTKSLARLATVDGEREVQALGHISKLLDTRDGRWGLATSSKINPRYLRDHIYTVLSQSHTKTPLHFSVIANIIRGDARMQSSQDVAITDGAVRNELIWDNRFTRIGRGTYALSEWGFSNSSLSGTIIDVLREADAPLDTHTIVERVQQRWYGKENSIKVLIQRLSKTVPQIARVYPGVYAWRDRDAGSPPSSDPSSR